VIYHWTPICESCGIDGPTICSGMNGLTFGPDHVTSSDLLKQWLDVHAGHAIRLRGESLRWNVTHVPQTPLIRLDPAGPLAISLSGPSVAGQRQIIGNRGSKPIVIRESGNEGLPNRFVFPAGVSEVIVPPHGTAVFVAKKPTRWQRLWGRLTRRAPLLRWTYQPWDHAAPKSPDEGGAS
jgi:hypothetical protein